MIMKHGLALTLAAALAAGVSAQNRPPELPPRNAAAAPVPLYQSAFTGYQSFREPEAMAWRESNDQVRDAGGMGGHNMGKMGGGATMPEHDMSKTSEAPVSAPDTQKAKPGHDMSKMKDGAAASMEMPGHDLGKMQAPQAASKAARTPAPAASVKGTPNAMPGHDMANMGKAKPERGTRPAPKAAKEPAAEMPQKMDHSKMTNNKE